MVTYWVKTPKWLKFFFPKELVWDMPIDSRPTVYITFDDGPNPNTTPFILAQLKKYNAQATFFCVGNNVTRYPALYHELLQNGHTTGNHTYNHLNGWKTENDLYLENIAQAKAHIHNHLFRPPYGKIKNAQLKLMKRSDPSWKIIMWDVLSADFDPKLTGEQCVTNVLSHIMPGSIVLLHDSEKAWPRMSYALPYILDYCKQKNWAMKAITL